jgi:hypothetical protein
MGRAARKEPPQGEQTVKHFLNASIAAAIAIALAPAAHAGCGLSNLPGSSVVPEATIDSRGHAGATANALPQGSAPFVLPNAIVGLWLTTFTSGGQTVDQGFDVWTSDGTEFLNDTPPPATGNVCFGVWQKTGPNTFVLKHPSWTFDGQGNLNGTAIIRETVSVDMNLNSFKGTFSVDLYTLNNVNVGHFTGTISATRITATN